MEQPRRGCQTPTRSFTLPYTHTKGGEAVGLYNQTGRTAQEWQELILAHMMAVNPDGLWTHMHYGYSVPRRNGKNETLIARELWALKNGEHVMHTAHRTTTSHAAWERLCKALSAIGLVEKEDFRTLKRFGLEEIEMLDGGGRATFRTRSSKGGLGEGFDLLVIDEAQEYQDDQESALKYVVTDSQNPQTIFLGTPPTPLSSGTVFTKFRADVLGGNMEDCGWAEWSVEEETDPEDVESWYLTNPSLGSILRERSIRAEIGTDKSDFNIQRLGLWIRYNQKSAISAKEWAACKIEGKPKLCGRLSVGVKYGADGANASLSVAVKTEGGQTFIETVDCRPQRSGTDWLVSFLKSAEPNMQALVVDGKSGQDLLSKALKDAGVKISPTFPTTGEVIAAYADFEAKLFSGKICHAGQPSLAQSATNCEHRAIGSGGGFGYRSIKVGVDVTLLESVVLAHWACGNIDKQKARQSISY